MIAPTSCRPPDDQLAFLRAAAAAKHEDPICHFVGAGGPRWIVGTHTLEEVAGDALEWQRLIKRTMSRADTRDCVFYRLTVFGIAVAESA